MPAEARSARVARIVASQALQRGLGLLVPILVTPFALRVLGREQYGAWLLGAALSGYAVQTLGIPHALVDLTATAVGRGDRSEAARASFHALVILAGCGVLVLAVAPWVVDLGGLSVAGGDAVLWAALCIAAASLPLASIRAVCEGLQEVHRVNVAAALALAVAAPVTLAGLRVAASPLWLFVPVAATTIAAPLATIPWLLRHRAWVGHTAWSGALARELIRRGAWYTVVGGAWAVIYGIDVWVVERTSGLAAVAPYGLSFTLFSLIAEPLGALVMAVRPVAGQLGAVVATAAAPLFRKTVRLATVAGAALNGAALFWFPVAMDAWVGRAGISGETRVAAFLAAFQTMRAVLNACAWLVVPLEGPRRLAVALTIDAAVNLGASVLFGLRFGPWGVAAGSLVGILACSGWYIPLHARAVFRTPLFGRWIFGAILGFAPLWLAGIFVAPRLSDFRGPAGTLTLGACLLGTAAYVGVLLYRLGLEKDERKLVRRWVRGVR